MTLRLDEWQSILYLCGTAWDKAAIEEYITDDLYIRQVQEPVAVVLSDGSMTAFYVTATGAIL